MPRAGLTPDAVIDAASAIADKDGLAAVTLARLAEKLGVRSPSLYKHVDSLDAVRRALAVRGIAEANARIQRATIGKARNDALFALAHAYWQFARDKPGLYAASLRAAKPGEKDVAAAGEALIGTVLSVLAGYGVNRDDALHATRGLRAIIHGFVSLDAAGGFRLKLDLNESFDRLLAAFARDLAERGR
ncbi:MAG: WHG domain-containing protein [Bauldia sp.]|nr:WHG domain-containing protein [Bauldia sp.]